MRAIKVNQLSIYMSLSASDASNICISQGRGYKLIFHLPNEVPTPFHDEYFISFDYERMLTLSAKSFRTDDELRKYPPDVRRCYFDGERKLKYFKSYTKYHCDYECLANYTLDRCGCVKFSMPRSQDTPVCDLNRTMCYFDAMLHWPGKSEHGGSAIMPCNCLPSCSDVKYSVKLDKIGILDSSVRLAHVNGNIEKYVRVEWQIKSNYEF
jgi:acid-sensing ion channel, other